MFDDVLDTTFVLSSLLDDHRYFWTIKAVDTNTDGTWADDILSFYTYLPKAPESFSLIYPNVDDTLDSRIVLFGWNESLDPDPCDSVEYSIFFSFEDSSISIIPESLWVDTGVVNTEINIDSLFLDIIEGDTVSWWVAAS